MLAPGLLATTMPDPTIRATSHLGRPHHEIHAMGAIWLYDDAGGGFSSLIDGEGRDWIGFKPEPLADFPAAAAAGYRGLGNLVHGGEDSGVGHPGFDLCETVFEAPATLRTRSLSGRWEFTWTFHPDRLEFTMIRADPDRDWWFLYEGNPGGRFAPEKHLWGTVDAIPRAERPSISDQLREPLRRVWFGHHDSPWRLILEHVTERPEIANLWWMGAEARGQWRESSDGMLVFGFGRGQGADGPLLRGPQRIIIRFVPAPASDAGPKVPEPLQP